jgi:hypothetical protein
MENTIDRSVWGTSTDDFKRHFREYLKDLAQSGDCYRVELIENLEWCFDRWNHWRQKFYPETSHPLLYPFFQAGKRGNELGHYSTVGDSGQPSVIHIKRSYLLGTADTTVWKIGPTKKLVLRKGHPNRLKYVDQTILHELVHQYLTEGAPDSIRNEYVSSELGGYKGHGPLFAAECNRINEILHPEMGFEFVPVRHSKKTHARVNKQRPSCAQFTHGELFWKWDPTATDLNGEQVQENRERLQQALTYLGGAVELVEEAETIETDFPAPFDSSCADVCLTALTEYDKAEQTDLVEAFQLAILRQLQQDDQLEKALQAIGYSAAVLNIPPASSGNGNGHKVAAIPESGPTVPSRGDGEEVTSLGLGQAYPVQDPEVSLHRLLADLAEEKASGGNNQTFALRRFGHQTGQQLSRHIKRLKAESEARTGVAV